MSIIQLGSPNTNSEDVGWVQVLFGTDSHTCNAGAFGQFATGIGNTDAGFIMGTGKLLIKVFVLGPTCADSLKDVIEPL